MKVDSNEEKKQTKEQKTLDHIYITTIFHIYSASGFHKFDSIKVF